MNVTFVETRIFSKLWNELIVDQGESLRELQSLLLETPLSGRPIPGCAILRKLRFADEKRNKGKRGGVRVIYIHTPLANRIDLITVYGKNEQDDLTKDQI